MTEEITIEVSELHAEMFDVVENLAGERQTRQQFETFTHELFQTVQAQQEQQAEQFQIEEPEERE